MRLRVTPGRVLAGRATVPGDKSIAHRWLLVATIARGRSSLHGLPRSLDVRATASCLAAIAGTGRGALEAWASSPAAADEPGGSTWNGERSRVSHLEVEGEGRDALREPGGPLDCRNSGTTMRLVAGVVAAAPFETVLVGDESLSRRPMERVAAPLRRMGADVVTAGGRPPLRVRGGDLRPIVFRAEVPSAQVKGAVLLAAVAADGTTTIAEPATTRDHTERLLGHLGATVGISEGRVELTGPFRPGGFAGTVPGDVSSAAFLAAGAALSGGSVEVAAVGVNPSRLRWLEVARRLGVEVERADGGAEAGEPVGTLTVGPPTDLRGTRVPPEELPLVIDEIPVLAALAAHAEGETRFEGAGELRVKESDRLSALVEGLRALGGDAEIEGDTLVVAGGGLRGGTASGAGDHRIAMALAVAALAAGGPSEVDGSEAAEVSYPGFATSLRSLGADVEEVA
jgi:3-phosphoshikimate 1-carboxyvinyltransferase